jgi:hypothetical protein
MRINAPNEQVDKQAVVVEVVRRVTGDGVDETSVQIQYRARRYLNIYIRSSTKKVWTIGVPCRCDLEGSALRGGRLEVPNSHSATTARH